MALEISGPAGSRHARLLAASVAVMAVLSGVTPAWAQSAAPAAAGAPSREQLNPAGRLPPPPPRETDLFAPDPPGPCPLAGSDVQVTLTSVGFRGVTALQPGDLAPAYAGYIGKPISVAALCEIRDHAASILFDHGILARVEIPEQRISSGAFELQVIEAQIVNVRVRGDAGPAQAAVERYVEKLRGMKPFDMRKAQRYLLLASDIPGVKVRATVRPSASGEAGAVDIDVTASRETYNVVGNVQNLGSKAIGQWGGLVRADLNGMTPFGERSSLIGFHTLDSNEQWVVQFLEEGRFGGEGLVGRMSLAYGETRPGDVLKPLGLKSDSFVGGVEAAYPLIRSRNRNLNLAGGLDWVDQTTDVRGVSRLSRDKLRVFYLRADGDLQFRPYDRPILFTGGLALRQGVSGLGASDAGSLLLTRAAGKPDATVVRGSLGMQTAAGPLGFNARLNAQYTKSPLLSFEQLSLGNLSTPRGYDPSVISGDSGVSGGIELRYSNLSLSSRISVSPYVFYDVGWIDNNHPSLDPGILANRTLQSVGAGMTFRLTERAVLDVVYAHPLDGVAPGIDRKDGRILVSLTSSLH